MAQIVDSHNTHGWSIAALLREMLGLSGKAMSECVESIFFENAGPSWARSELSRARPNRRMYKPFAVFLSVFVLCSALFFWPPPGPSPPPEPDPPPTGSRGSHKMTPEKPERTIGVVDGRDPRPQFHEKNPLPSSPLPRGKIA